MDTSLATTLSPMQSQVLANLKTALANTKLGTNLGKSVVVLSTAPSAGETLVALQFVEFLAQEGYSALTLAPTGREAARLAQQFPQPVMTLTGYYQSPPSASMDCIIVLNAERAAPEHLQALAEQAAAGVFVVLTASKDHLYQVVSSPWDTPLHLTYLTESFRQRPLPQES